MQDRGFRPYRNSDTLNNSIQDQQQKDFYATPKTQK